MKARIIYRAQLTPGATPLAEVEQDEFGKFWYPAGTVLEDPRAYRLVQMGVAEPADEECTLRACMTKAEMKTAQRQQEMVAKGIAPEDYQRYLDGEILGYDAEGNDIPGPNAIEDVDDDDTGLILPEGYEDI